MGLTPPSRSLSFSEYILLCKGTKALRPPKKAARLYDDTAVTPVSVLIARYGMAGTVLHRCGSSTEVIHTLIYPYIFEDAVL